MRACRAHRRRPTRSGPTDRQRGSNATQDTRPPPPRARCRMQSSWVQCSGPAAGPSIQRLQGIAQLAAEFGQLVGAVAVLYDKRCIGQVAQPLVQHARRHPLAPREQRSSTDRPCPKLPHHSQGPTTAEQVHRCHEWATCRGAADGMAGLRSRSSCHPSSGKSLLTFLIPQQYRCDRVSESETRRVRRNHEPD
jgi:hypothetical protein